MITTSPLHPSHNHARSAALSNRNYTENTNAGYCTDVVEVDVTAAPSSPAQDTIGLRRALSGALKRRPVSCRKGLAPIIEPPHPVFSPQSGLVDEHTAVLAVLLNELCAVSAIAGVDSIIG